jgi:hypothetical protein
MTDILTLQRDPRPDDIAAAGDRLRAVRLLNNRPVALSSLEAAEFNTALVSSVLAILGCPSPNPRVAQAEGE